MDSWPGKLFVGGLPRETDEESLRLHFTKYGQVRYSEIIKDRVTGVNKGFGFITFSDPSSVQKALQDRHTILGKKVEVKTARPRVERYPVGDLFERYFVNNGGIINETKKIFVGGLPPDLTTDEFRHYFEGFGTVEDVVVMYDKVSNRPRGFGFITFVSGDSVDNVLRNSFHELKNKRVEVKRAEPKDQMNRLYARVYDTSFGIGRVPNFFNGFGNYSVYYCPTNPYYGCLYGGNPYGLDAYSGNFYGYPHLYGYPNYYQSPSHHPNKANVSLPYLGGLTRTDGWDRMTRRVDVKSSISKFSMADVQTSISPVPPVDAPHSTDQQQTSEADVIGLDNDSPVTSSNSVEEKLL